MSAATAATAFSPSVVALAGGGWVGLETGWFYNTLQLGAVGYITQPLWTPQNKWETSDGKYASGEGSLAAGRGYRTLT